MFLWLIRRVLLPKINEKTKQVLQSMLCAISSPWYCFRTLSWVSSKRTRTDSEYAYMNLSQGQNAPGAANNADGLKRAVVPQTFQAPDHVKHVGGFQEYFGEWEYKLWVPHAWSKTYYGPQQPMQYTAGGGAPAAGRGGTYVLKTSLHYSTFVELAQFLVMIYNNAGSGSMFPASSTLSTSV